MDPSAIGGGIVANLVAKILEVLAKEAFKKAKSLWGARGDLKRLQQTIELIGARVRDAERYQEAERQEFVKQWLLKVKLVLYQADDLFDTVITLDVLDPPRTGRLSKVRNLLSKSNRDMVSEIKSIRKQLVDLKSDMDWLPLPNQPARQRSITPSPLISERETGAFVDPAGVFGRKNDAQKILDMLFDPIYDDGEHITVIPIVGFGGLGKTTLAQLVFNDERVKHHFEPTTWAYMGDINNLNVIKRKIYQAFTRDDRRNPPVVEIEEGIVKSLANKKYLLVLDDLWTENGADLTNLLRLLKQGVKGSRVIVTTRSNVVAKLAMHFGPSDTTCYLDTLTKDESWEMFKRSAFTQGQESNHPELITIGKDIVKMCGNVPLAIEVVGGSLCSEHTQLHWLQVKKDLSETRGDNRTMATLKISYDYLPTQSKLCFAYCSLFPKGYEFRKDDLVHLWMAQGYVELDKGKRYFMDLVARNFFQGLKFSLGRYKMHDLLHDLAQAVAGDEILGYERLEQIHDPDGLIHVNINGSTWPSSMKNAKRLRSLLQFTCNAGDENLFSEFQSLRVLSISNDEIHNLPNSIGSFIHLRYVNLHMNKIERLPDSITRLVNLQTLDLFVCNDLKELPTEFSRLVNLRHLLLPPRYRTKLTDLPPGFGKLTCLQELNRFIVKGNGIDSLGAWNLRGLMWIEFRRWRGDAIEEVKRASLKNNHYLTCLYLCLGLEEEETTPADGEMNEMLKCLQLPPNLEHLSVWEYKGSELPGGWLDGLCKLVSISISHCKRCKALPHLRLLPHLKSLTLRDLDELEYIEDEDNTATQNIVFQSLEKLELWRCYKLKGWRRASKDIVVSLRLLRLVLAECPMLMCMHVAPKLESLDVNNINWKMVESNLSTNHEEEVALSSLAPPYTSTLFTSLKELGIEDADNGLITLSISSSLCNLSTITISNCSNLRKLRFESSNFIQKLTISGCRRLGNISEGLQHLSVLEDLKIRLMENLTELPEETGQLPLLRRLLISGCPKVKSLPPSIQGLAFLQTLEIRNCPDLAKKSMPDGEDWHLIKHIPNIEMSNVFKKQDGKVVEHIIAKKKSSRALHIMGWKPVIRIVRYYLLKANKIFRN